MKPLSKSLLALATLIASVLVTANGSAGEPTVPKLAFNPSVVLRLPAQPARLNEQNRPWVDSTGQHAVVAKLTKRQGQFVGLERADGQFFWASPNAFAMADRVYAIHQTEPRVNPDARVLVGKLAVVRDGDTVQIQTLDGKTKTIRLDGIDAPEKHQEDGKTASDWLARLIGHEVRVEYIEEDRYRRVLGQIYLSDRWVNYEMVLAGYAWHYTKYNEDQRLAAAHAHAKQTGRGIWMQEELIAPWDYRNGVRKETTAPLNVPSIRESDTVVYVTESGHHYHTESCHHVRQGGIKIPLSRAASAYEGCRVCRPPQRPVAETADSRESKTGF